jgi:integrase
MLLLTGQRRGEVAGMTWDELDLDGRVWNIPSDRTKNGHAHIVPLSEAVIDLIKAQTEVEGCPNVFVNKAGNKFNNYSRPKARLEELSSVTGWTLHDLRRTFATHLNDELEVRAEVIEAALNHLSGAAKVGVAGIYMRGSYEKERRKAMTKWANHLTALVREDGDNVVSIRSADK